MAGRIVEYRGLKFEIWCKSLRLIEPKISPIIDSHTDLYIDWEAQKQKMNVIICILNLGIEIIEERRKQTTIG